MAHYVKSEEVSQAAGQVATPSLVVRGMEHVRALHQTTRPECAAPADKAFIESLYGDA